MKLMPVEKLALVLAGWAVLATAAFFFHEIAFMACIVMLVNKGLEFKFVYENTRIESEAIHGDDRQFEQMVIPGVDGETKAR